MIPCYVFGMNAEFSKMKIGQMEKTIQPPLSLGIKELKIKKYSLFSG
jgi:hypothetical protein